MERLTRKSLEYKDIWIADGSLSNIEGVVRGNAIDRLAELENIFESWDIENLEELKTRLHDCQVYHLKNNSNETLIHNLKNELAELKQKAIVPKFQIGQKIFFIDTNFQIEQGIIYQIRMFQMDSNEWGNHLIDLGQEYEDDIRFIYEDEEDIFATREEAEQKLAEIGGKDE